MCLGQVRKQRNFQDRSKHWALIVLNNFFFARMKTDKADNPPSTNVLVIKFGTDDGHSET